MRKQKHVDHGTFIDDQRIAFNRLRRQPKGGIGDIVVSNLQRKQPVQRLRVHPANFGQTPCRASRRRRQQDLFAALSQNTRQKPYGRRLPCSGTSRQHGKRVSQRHHNRSRLFIAGFESLLFRHLANSARRLIFAHKVIARTRDGG